MLAILFGNARKTKKTKLELIVVFQHDELTIGTIMDVKQC
jgi:hypothetical protein